MKLVDIFKTEVCLPPLGFCQTHVWNHHYLATSGPGNENDNDDDDDDDDDDGDDDVDDDDDDEHLPAATPSGASSKTRQC